MDSEEEISIVDSMVEDSNVDSIMEDEREDESEDKSGQDQITFKKTMADLEKVVAEEVIRGCKLDACFDRFLQSLYEIKRISWSLPAFASFKGKDAEQLKRIAAEMKSNINRLLPGYLDGEVNVLSDERLRWKLDDRLVYLQRHDLLRDERKHNHDGSSVFQRSLLNTLITRHHRQLADGIESSKAPALKQIAFDKAYHQLDELISAEAASASFACGGTIPIRDAPIHIFWTAREDSTMRKLALPLNHNTTSDSSINRLYQLVTDCETASFGRGQQDVIDLEYRKAGKLDPHRFGSSFDPANLGIIKKVEQILLPSFNTTSETRFRKISAELCKLNVYSGPSGLFRKHVDTPRSENQIGSLVVCLPSPFKGGNLVVRHHGRQVEFNWASQSATAIQWAAFYSDCEHEIKTVTEGERLTLSYNLYVTEPAGKSTPASNRWPTAKEPVDGSIPPVTYIVDPKTLPLYGFLKDLITVPGFMNDGGVLGIYCSHAYSHTAYNAEKQFPRMLKGVDLVLHSTFKSLGIEVDILPVIRNDRGGWGSGQLLRYLRHGTEPKLHPIYDIREVKIPGILDYTDVDEHWKTLHFCRRVLGMDQTAEFVQKHNLPASRGFNRTEEVFLGNELHPYDSTDVDYDFGDDKIMEDNFPSLHLSGGITWLAKPKHKKKAFRYMAHGNEPASRHTMYSYAAILAVIPPFAQRQAIIAAAEN